MAKLTRVVTLGFGPVTLPALSRERIGDVASHVPHTLSDHDGHVHVQCYRDTGSIVRAKRALCAATSTVVLE